MGLDFRQSHNFYTILAFNPEGCYNFSDNSGRATDSYVFVAHWAVLVQNQPIFNASFAKELVAIVTFFGISSDLYMEK